MKSYCHWWFLAALAVLPGCENNRTSSSSSTVTSVSSASGSRTVVSVNGATVFQAPQLEASSSVSKTEAIAATTQLLEIENTMGPVRVIGTESGATEWTWKITAHAETEERARQAVAEAVCRVEVVGHRLRLVVTLPEARNVRRDYDDGAGNSMHVSMPEVQFESELIVHAPIAASVVTTNHYAATEISGLTGNADATGQSGPVDIRNVRGTVKATTSYANLKVVNTGAATLKNQSGPIDATDVHGGLNAETSYAALTAVNVDGAVRLRDNSGSVHVTNAGAADVQTSYADLRVADIRGDVDLADNSGRIDGRGITGSVNARTSYANLDISAAGSKIVCINQSGPIAVQATGKLATLEATTSYAGLEVRLPAKLQPAVTAHTSYAEVESDFPVLLKPKGQDPFADTAPGTPRISLQNQSGGIRILGE